MDITTMIAFILMIVTGVAVAIFGKWRLNTMTMVLGALLALAGVEPSPD